MMADYGAIILMTYWKASLQNQTAALQVPTAIKALACVAGARKGKGEGKIGRAQGRYEAPAARELFISSRPLISMQTANIHDRLLVKCQPMKIVLTFRGNPERAKKCRVEYG